MYKLDKRHLVTYQKKNYFFVYCENSNIFTGPTHFLPVKGPVLFLYRLRV